MKQLEDCFRKQGELLPNSPIQYETATEMKSRFLECMSKYREHQTVVVVAHRMLMRQFVPNEKIDFLPSD